MIFGRNLGRRYSGSATPEVLHDLIGRCLSPDMSLGAGGEPLEAIVVIKQLEAVKVLPVYGIDSLWSADAKHAHEQLKASHKGLNVEVHIVVELCIPRGMIVQQQSIIDDVFSYEQFLANYSSVAVQ